MLLWAVVGVLGVAALIAALEVLSGVRIAARADRGRSTGMADLLLYRRLVAPDTIALANGGYLAMFEVAAPDAEAYDDASLANVDAGISRALSVISERFVVHLRERHERSFEYDSPTSYPHAVLAFLDARRREYFASGSTYRTKRILALTWMPPGSVAKALSFGGTYDDGQETGESRTLAAFQSEVEGAIGFLRSYAQVRRLAVRRDTIDGITVDRSEMLEELAMQISGRARRVSVPRTLLALNSLLAEPMRGGTDIRIGESEIAIVVLKDFPPETEPLALARIRQLGADYEWVVRWMPLSPAETKKLLKSAHTEWRTKSNEDLALGDPHSLAMMNEATIAAGMASNGDRFGLLSPFLVLRAADRRTVDAVARRALAIFDELGYSAFISSLTAEDDFFAGLASDGYHGIRRYQMHALNLAHLFSLHEHSSGPRYLGIPSLPKTSPALLCAAAGRGQENGLYRLSLSTEPPDLLHFFAIGGPGSGKSVALAVIAESWFARVPFAGVTAIDRGRSMYRLARFLDAPYYDLLGANSPGFALFSEVKEDASQRREVESILVGMCEIQGVTMTPNRSAAITAALDNISELPPRLRSLTAFVELLSDPEDVLRSALSVYTRVRLNGAPGRLGGTLDAEEDSFDVARFTVVDLGALWTETDPKYLIPTLLVMFWKMRTAVKRRRERSGNMLQHWMFTIDEAHTLLRHPLGQRFISDTLLLGRREKFALGLMTQTARHFAESPVLGDVLASVMTRMYFRDSSVLDTSTARDGVKTSRDFYTDLELPEHGIARLPEVAPHSFLLHQPHTRELAEVSLRLDRATLAILGRTDEAQNRWLDTMIERFPDTWRYEVLRSEGVSEENIAELMALIAAMKREAAVVA